MFVKFLKLGVLKVETFNFAVFMAISNPLEYCLKYGGSFISGEMQYKQVAA